MFIRKCGVIFFCRESALKGAGFIFIDSHHFNNDLNRTGKKEGTLYAANYELFFLPSFTIEKKDL
jgi:hypothetical protein